MLEMFVSGTTLIVITMIIFVILELRFPAHTYPSALKMSSYLSNLAIFFFNTIVTFLISVGSVWLVAESLSVGFFDRVWGVNALLSLILGFLILELAIWFWHRLNHVIPLLWRFHQAHHSERYLNASSALRFHIGELLLSVLFKSILIILTGLPLWVFFIHETAITIFAIMHHANIKLPLRYSLLMSKVFITPRMHYAHHSTVRSEHNSNYGVVFSWWDHIFGTVNRKIPEEIGLSYTKKYMFEDFLFMPVKKFSKK